MFLRVLYRFVVDIDGLSGSHCLFHAKDGRLVLVRFRGLGEVYKRRDEDFVGRYKAPGGSGLERASLLRAASEEAAKMEACRLYTSDAADDLPCVGPGGRRFSNS